MAPYLYFVWHNPVVSLVIAWIVATVAVTVFLLWAAHCANQNQGRRHWK